MTRSREVHVAPWDPPHVLRSQSLPEGSVARKAPNLVPPSTLLGGTGGAPPTPPTLLRNQCRGRSARLVAGRHPTLPAPWGPALAPARLEQLSPPIGRMGVYPASQVNLGQYNPYQELPWHDPRLCITLYYSDPAIARQAISDPTTPPTQCIHIGDWWAEPPHTSVICGTSIEKRHCRGTGGTGGAPPTNL